VPDKVQRVKRTWSLDSSRWKMTLLDMIGVVPVRGLNCMGRHSVGRIAWSRGVEAGGDG
jgi:hypothetical protein